MIGWLVGYLWLLLTRQFKLYTVLSVLGGMECIADTYLLKASIDRQWQDPSLQQSIAAENLEEVRFDKLFLWKIKFSLRFLAIIYF